MIKIIGKVTGKLEFITVARHVSKNESFLIYRNTETSFIMAMPIDPSHAVDTTSLPFNNCFDIVETSFFV